MRPKGIGIDQYRGMALAGHTASETARLLGVSKTTVQGVARRNGLTFVDGRKNTITIDGHIKNSTEEKQEDIK